MTPEPVCCWLPRKAVPLFWPKGPQAVTRICTTAGCTWEATFARSRLRARRSCWAGSALVHASNASRAASLASGERCRSARPTGLLDRIRFGSEGRHQAHVTLDTLLAEGIERPMPFPPACRPLLIPSCSRYRSPETQGQLFGRLRTVLRTLRETGENYFVECWRQLDLGPTGWGDRRFVGMLQHHRHGGGRVEDQLAGHQPVGDAPQSIDVRPVIHLSSEYCFRRDVRGGPCRRIGRRQQRLARIRALGLHQPEIEHFDEIKLEAKPAGEDVSRLDITVNQPVDMGFFE